jgi:hypothetical protein
MLLSQFPAIFANFKAIKISIFLKNQCYEINAQFFREIFRQKYFQKS